ncbi:MAG: hypothetical protein KIT20_06995 [Alphaproteobacteria bacterium]|nr:hypothetical protein [Alphaproteobacteria bacterium]
MRCPPGMGILVFLLLACLLPGQPARGEETGWRLERVARGGDFHGLQGLAFDAGDNLHAGSFAGPPILRVNVRNGRTSEVAGIQHAMAGGIAFGPDGAMYWTSPLLGSIRAFRPGEPVRVVAEGLPGVKAIGFDRRGRLFAAQIHLADTLLEIDPAGRRPPRKVGEGLGGMNGFALAPDGKLVGAIWSKGQVVEIDPDSARQQVLTDGLRVPSAVAFDGEGALFVADGATGQIIRVERPGGDKSLLARMAAGIDALAIDSRNQLFAANPVDNAIHRIDRLSGRSTRVLQGRLGLPGGLSIADAGEEQMLYVADLFALRAITLRTGSLADIARTPADPLRFPTNVNVSSAGTRYAYLSSWYSGTVQRIDRRSGRAPVLFEGFNAPMHAIDLPGNAMLVAEYGEGRLVKVLGRDGAERQVLAEGLGGPVAMARIGWEAVYVSEELTGTISRVSLETGERRIVARDLSQPEGIALLPSGRLVVAEVGRQRLIEIDPADGRIEVILGNLPIGLTAPASLPASFVLTGVAVSKAGDVYFSSDVENAIYRVSRR